MRKDMQTTEIQTTTFNPIQLHLLQMFSHMRSDKELVEVKNVLSEYYFDKVERLGAQLAAEKGWTSEDLQAMSREHFRTEYK